MNPEYEDGEIRRALKWATATALDLDPFCAVLILPRFKMASYMNLFSHPCVTLIAKFERSTFSFMPPTHWEGVDPVSGPQGTAKWPVLFVEVSNGAWRSTMEVAGTRAARAVL